jgi:hypothetical protein
LEEYNASKAVRVSKLAKKAREIRRWPPQAFRLQGEEMKARHNAGPSNRGYFIFAGGCVLAAIVLIALIVHGEVRGTRVAPDIEQKAKALEE